MNLIKAMTNKTQPTKFGF